MRASGVVLVAWWLVGTSGCGLLAGLGGDYTGPDGGAIDAPGAYDSGDRADAQRASDGPGPCVLGASTLGSCSLGP
jgi:hypothetical protein